jgi:hypothetical protein
MNFDGLDGADAVTADIVADVAAINKINLCT